MRSIKKRLQIRVVGAPDKSRVETQARLCIQLLTSSGTKVSNWSYLKLPERLLSRSRLKRAIQQQQQQQRVSTTTPPSSPEGVNGILLSDESQVLSLDAKVICATQPDQPVYVCSACIQRERKRAERSKTGNHQNTRRLLDIPEQDRICSSIVVPWSTLLLAMLFYQHALLVIAVTIMKKLVSSKYRLARAACIFDD